MAPLRILLLCKKFPWPPHDGETIAIFGLLRELSALGHSLTVLSIGTPKHPARPEQLPPAEKALARWEAVAVDTRIRPFAALRNWVASPLPYVLERFRSEAFAARLRKILSEQTFDIIQLEGIFLALYLPEIRAHSSAKVILRAHNVEHEIWERLAQKARNPLKKAYLNLLARRMARFEQAQAEAFDGLVPITARDLDRFEAMGYCQEALVIPAGADLGRLRADRSQLDFPSVFHLGSMDWLPNQEGVRWFLDLVWPTLAAQHPDWRFYLAGRNMPPEFAEQAAKVPGVVVVGEVPDAPAFMNGKALLVVPLRSGGGMRVKLVEALALGKTVVSTCIGAEGLEATHGQHLLIADTPEAFGRAVSECLTDRALFDRLGTAGQLFIRENYDNKQLALRLAKWLSERC